MIIDALLQFSDAQDIKSGGASESVVDLGQANPDVGLWEHKLNVVVCATTEFKGSGTGVTLKVDLQDCDTENGTFETVLSTGALPAPTGNAPLILPMPAKHRRYLKLNYTVAATGESSPTVSAGAVSAYLTDALQANSNWMPEK